MLKLKRLNKKGNLVECVIKVEDIIGTTEKELEPTNLYDDLGNLVKTETYESIYQIRFANNDSIYLNKETYDKLIAKLKVETLD